MAECECETAMETRETETPEALPVHPHARSRFHGLNATDVSGCCRGVSQQLLETLRYALEDPGDDVDDLVEELIHTHGELEALEASSRSLEARLTSAKQKYRKSARKDPIDIAAWSQYAREDAVAVLSLSKILKSEPAELGSRSRVSKEDRLLGALVHLWQDPTAMMPDEQSNDDDLHIEGGKIELRCPITCQGFKQPMISKRCKHVFDLEGLESYFQGHASRDCPQGGCSQKLSMNDFEVDELMKLRCQIDRVRKKSVPKEEAVVDVI